jgi:hypothetical protein
MCLALDVCAIRFASCLSSVSGQPSAALTLARTRAEIVNLVAERTIRRSVTL